jgi:cell division protein FtsB
LVLAVLAMLGVLVLGAFPVRAYFGQLRQREELAARVRSLQADNAKLTSTAALLQADETIERLARERYQLVRPGEEAYAILPDSAPAPAPAPAVGPPPAGPAPAAAPVVPSRPPGGNFLTRTWDRIASVL